MEQYTDLIASMTPEEYRIVRRQLQWEGRWHEGSYREEVKTNRRAERLIRELRDFRDN